MDLSRVREFMITKVKLGQEFADQLRQQWLNLGSKKSPAATEAQSGTEPSHSKDKQD